MPAFVALMFLIKEYSAFSRKLILTVFADRKVFKNSQVPALVIGDKCLIVLQ